MPQGHFLSRWQGYSELQTAAQQTPFQGFAELGTKQGNAKGSLEPEHFPRDSESRSSSSCESGSQEANCRGFWLAGAAAMALQQTGPSRCTEDRGRTGDVLGRADVAAASVPKPS